MCLFFVGGVFCVGCLFLNLFIYFKVLSAKDNIWVFLHEREMGNGDFCCGVFCFCFCFILFVAYIVFVVLGLFFLIIIFLFPLFNIMLYL